MSEYRRVKGTRDLLPPETAVWAAVEATARRVFALYGYQEVRTPLLEHTELFVRTVGESTDIVGKEMYTFPDRKGRSLTLRPENTAPVARAFLEGGLQAGPLPVKLFYIGPQFRYERPQKGRYRQFHQIGAELIGDASPHADAELLLMLDRFLRELGFSELEVLLNTVGDAPSRGAYAEALRAYLQPHADALGADSKRRLETNPLRILDSKDPKERELLAGAPALADHLTDAARAHFAAVREALDRFGVRYKVSDRLVRGLDYYTDTVFEIVSRDLGAQDALVGGGRYDELVADLGGPRIPSIGFAIGEDRLIEVMPMDFREQARRKGPVMILPVTERAIAFAQEVAENLRAAGIPAEIDTPGRSLRKAEESAGKKGSRWLVLVGEHQPSGLQTSLHDLKRERTDNVLDVRELVRQLTPEFIGAPEELAWAARMQERE
ncbi:MAG TPA: histidine--tRNA ligase [Thermoanaerobaculia bacterium]|jgi:histidyl-tRNA synthetase|nr:histidine--tRNA ligase [Thermoanaerobaculia bacterium]